MAKFKPIPPFIVGDKDNLWGGLNTSTKDFRTLERGQSYDQLNWLTGRDKDHIELRRGSALLGTTRRNVSKTSISGIGVGINNFGEEVPFFSFNQKLLFYNTETLDTQEVDTTNILPVAAIGDQVSFMPYQNLAGSYLYITSKHSSIYKASIANLGTVLDLGTVDYHFGFAKINRGYMFGMNRAGASQNSNDVTGLYLSTPDSIFENSTVLTFSAGTGDGTTKTFTGTISLTPPNTAYFVKITDTVETFTDDKNGLLVGSLGGTGTINYITGAFSVTFNTAPTSGQAIDGSYYEEDSTVNGVADFTGEGSDTFRQDDGGGIAQSVFSFQGVEYCFHVLRSWLLSIDVTTDPVSFDNEPYYEQIGVPNPLAAFSAGDGVLFLNNSNPANPQASMLEIPPGSTTTTVVPVSISDELDLSNFGWDFCVVRRWGDYNMVSCQDRVNGLLQPFNGVTFVQNNISALWNRLDYTIACSAEYNGTLIAGDSISANVFTLFSGFDDDGSVIENYHKQAYTDVGIQGLKTAGYLNLQGLIQPSQKLEVYISLDNGAYVLVYTILGTGPYVSNNAITIGSNTIGSTPVGGGNGNTQLFANEYELDIPIHTDKFEYISFMVRAIDVGYISVNRAEYKDIRFKRRRILSYEDLEINS